MDQKKAGKNASLTASGIVMCLVLVGTEDWHGVGIWQGCSLQCRMLYPFYHAGMVHALLNIWCMLSVVFIYEVSLWRLLIAYAMAVSVPDVCLSAVPTVGLSGAVFALLGSISFEVRRRLYYQIWMLAYLGVGFLMPDTNVWLHIYCYLTGLAVALLNMPVGYWRHDG